MILEPDEEEEEKPKASTGWQSMHLEPGKWAALGYAWLSAVGFAHLFGNGIAFGVNIIDLATVNDFLVAGIRNPIVPILAGLTGWGLYGIWQAARDNPTLRFALVPTVLVLLALAALLSGAYRQSVVSGAMSDQSFAPRDLKVAVEPGVELPSRLRLALATSDYLVFGDEDGESWVVARSAVRAMKVIPNP